MRFASLVMTAVVSIGLVQSAYAGCGCKAPVRKQPPAQQVAPAPAPQPQQAPAMPAQPQAPAVPTTPPAPTSEAAPATMMQSAGFSLQMFAQAAPAAPQAPSAAPQAAAPVGKIQWMTNFDDAAKMAQQQHKYLLLFFTGSDWCGWCKKIEAEVFSSPEFATAVGDKFVFVMLDFPMNKVQTPELSQQNNQLKQKYGITGYPTVIVLDSNQNFVAETGYRPGGGAAYGSYLLQLIGK